MEGAEKRFHIDVLSSLQDSYSLIFFAVVFATGSGFLISLEAMVPEGTILLLAGAVTVVNLCFSISNMANVKLGYLARHDSFFAVDIGRKVENLVENLKSIFSGL